MGTKVSNKQRQRTKAHPAAPVTPNKRTETSGWDITSWISGHSLALFIFLTAVATLRIVATYEVFNHTIDEPAHVACGMEWLDKGAYKYEPQHPPLSRVAAALGPYLAGIRSQGRPWLYNEGNAILYHNGQYDRNLILARLGILPFFWIASLVVYIWARRSLGPAEATLAVFLFTFLPPVLAHAGLATTDMALTAFAGAGYLAGLFWLENPSAANSALFGLCTGLAVLSKFSALPFLPASMAAALAWYVAVERPSWRRILASVTRCLLPFLLAVLVGAVVIWTGYRFSLGTVPFAKFRLPAPELFAGIKEVIAHNSKGHPAYLLGNRSEFGWWYYYPVILAFKTPLPFLALLVFGTARCLWDPPRAPRGVWLPLTLSLGVLLFSMSSQINIGVRHILPVYIGFSLVAAAGAARLLELARKAGWAKWTLGLLLVWMTATSLFSHPDYLPYFNALAGDEPEKVAVDSDLDWGQDMKRLGKRLQEVGAREVAFSPFISAYLEAVHGFPPIQPNDPTAPAPGWNAISLTVLKTARLGLYNEHPEIQLWPDRFKPTERLGKSTLLYYFPPSR